MPTQYHTRIRVAYLVDDREVYARIYTVASLVPFEDLTEHQQAKVKAAAMRLAEDGRPPCFVPVAGVRVEARVIRGD